MKVYVLDEHLQGKCELYHYFHGVKIYIRFCTSLENLALSITPNNHENVYSWCKPAGEMRGTPTLAMLLRLLSSLAFLRWPYGTQESKFHFGSHSSKTHPTLPMLHTIPACMPPCPWWYIVLEVCIWFLVSCVVVHDTFLTFSASLHSTPSHQCYAIPGCLSPCPWWYIVLEVFIWASCVLRCVIMAHNTFLHYTTYNTTYAFLKHFFTSLMPHPYSFIHPFKHYNTYSVHSAIYYGMKTKENHPCENSQQKMLGTVYLVIRLYYTYTYLYTRL